MTLTEYQERADYCRRMAAEAASDATRAHWLRVAEMWLLMADDHERDLKIEVDAVAKGQKDDTETP